jgi:hypothetical protein
MGGACSQSPELPPSSSVQSSSHGQDWGNLSAEPVRSLLDSQIFPPDGGRQHPSRFPAPIERPPRLDCAL